MKKENSQPLKTAWGQYTLHRFPLLKNDSLRAWDAADEYLLRYFSENTIADSTKNKGKHSVLLVNDAFGALAVSLHEMSPDCWSDSYLSQLATNYNLHHSQLAFQPRFIPSTELPTVERPYDVVVIKIPKTMALLEDQLIRLKAYISSDTRIVAAAMTKHIHSSTLKLFEKIIGSTTTSLAVKKARLIFSKYEIKEQFVTPVYPKTYPLKEFDITLTNHANVFAKDKLDRGAQLLIQQFKALPNPVEPIEPTEQAPIQTKTQKVVDLGCGNGVLGIVAQHYLPTSQLCFIDESYMAIASAKASYHKNYPDQQADFLIGNGLSDYQPDTIDLILCNPPFHQEHTVGEHLAWKMFQQSLLCLKRGGQLWIVANRHLNHHSKLKRLFGNSHLIASNKTFVVLAAKKR